MKRVLVFDLDDTLYNEITYVQSGFRAVSEYLKKHHNIDTTKSYQLMLEELKKGRGAVFNNVLEIFNINTSINVKKCIAAYRTHLPSIKLDKEAINCLERFSDWPKYLVTDGNKIVQSNKVKALKLHKFMNFCFVTHQYGIKNAKPSPYCFLKICKRENVNPSQVVYIADNPNKDFIGLKPLGFKTIRILKGPFGYKEFKKTNDADFKVNSLDELTLKYMDQVFS